MSTVTVSDQIYGTGSDGVATDPTSPLSRDMYYKDLTVTASATLDTGGYKVFVQNVLTVDGTLHNNGGNGSARVGGHRRSGWGRGAGQHGGCFHDGDRWGEWCRRPG